MVTLKDSASRDEFDRAPEPEQKDCGQKVTS